MEQIYDPERLATALAATAIPHVRGERLAAHTTIGIGGTADFYLTPRTEAEFNAAVALCRSARAKFTVLGGGSNVLVSDAGFRGAVISTEKLSRMTVEKRAGDLAFIRAEAGVPLVKLTHFACENGLGGTEFLAGIPGSVGGALAMNAGCFGRSVSDITVSVQAADGRKTVILSREMCGFTYRNSVFSGGGIFAISALFLTKTAKKDKIEETTKAFLSMRRGQPRARSMGSVFKNTAACPSGRLIEESGLKGTRAGGACISQEHANFIVNVGSASAEDVRTLISIAKAAVRERTGITLEEEIRYIGEFS